MRLVPRVALVLRPSCRIASFFYTGSASWLFSGWLHLMVHRSLFRTRQDVRLSSNLVEEFILILNVNLIWLRAAFISSWLPPIPILQISSVLQFELCQFCLVLRLEAEEILLAVLQWYLIRSLLLVLSLCDGIDLRC